MSSDGRAARIALAAAILFPLFFQLQGTVYNEPLQPLLDSGGVLSRVPLPISLPACLLGIFVLGRFRRASVALVCAVSLAAVMLLTTIAGAKGFDFESRKFLLLLQYLVPLVGLALGQMFDASPPDDSLERTFLWLVMCLVPLQLGLTLARGEYRSTHDMIFFSIYQHYQFVPVVFVGAYLVALFSLCRTKTKAALFVLGPVMAVHGGMSFSMLSVGLLILGLVVFVLMTRTRFSVALLLVACLAVFATFWCLRNTNEFRAKSDPGYVSPYPEERQAASPGPKFLPENVKARLNDWHTYGRGITESASTALLGHPEALSRGVSTSAHNYYLDFVYNFGLIAILPLLALIAFTVRLLLLQRHAIGIDLKTAGLAFVVLFILLVDSNFKVTLRQSYPGAFTFFLWGLLLSRLQTGEAHERAR